MPRRRGRPPKLPNSRGQWQCTKCKDWKDPNEFYKNVRTLNQLSSWCKLCLNEAQTERYTRLAAEREAAKVREFWPGAPDDKLARMVGLWTRRNQLAQEDLEGNKDEITDYTRRIDMLEMVFRTEGYDVP